MASDDLCELPFFSSSLYPTLESIQDNIKLSTFRVSQVHMVSKVYASFSRAILKPLTLSCLETNGQRNILLDVG